MAKALLGHTGDSSLWLVAEMRRLEQRVSDLETRLVRLQAENDRLAAAVHEGSLLTVEPNPEILESGHPV